MDNIQELREIVNPVFNTARSCLQLDAAAGDEDSGQLLEALGFAPFGEKNESKAVPEELAEKVRRLSPVYAVYTESRFQLVNQLIESRPDRVVVDLPCGYTARGIKMSHQGRTYYGFDLPAVIDVLEPAAKKIYGCDENIHYAAVDATNYESLAAPLANESGELMITTEGLLMYFTQQELEEVFSNIHRLLYKHGGSWILVDRTYYTYDRMIASAVLDNDQEMVALYTAITKKAAGTVADVKFYDNIFFKCEDDDIKSFINKMGFEVREICMGDYLPDHLGALKAIPGTEAGVRDVFAKMSFWELTVKSDTGTKTTVDRNLPFAVEAECIDGKFKASVQGRMDTITAPELLKCFQDTKEEITSIEIDVKNMAYISSAGLRVLLLMKKAVEDKSQFSLLNVSDGVKTILEDTGFDQIL